MPEINRVSSAGFNKRALDLVPAQFLRPAGETPKLGVAQQDYGSAGLYAAPISPPKARAISPPEGDFSGNSVSTQVT